MADLKTCPRCSAHVPRIARFCTRCGLAMTAAPKPAVAAGFVAGPTQPPPPIFDPAPSQHNLRPAVDNRRPQRNPGRRRGGWGWSWWIIGLVIYGVCHEYHVSQRANDATYDTPPSYYTAPQPSAPAYVPEYTPPVYSKPVYVPPTPAPSPYDRPQYNPYPNQNPWLPFRPEHHNDKGQ